MNLTDYVKQVSIEDFGWAFCHEAKWNHRLRTTGGRFFPSDKHLDFNPKYLECYGDDIFRKIVRHELCHYHLYCQGKGYKHRDNAFKNLLQKVDGLRYAPNIPSDKSRYLYECYQCGQQYFRQRRISLERYRCRKCRGHLLRQK